MQEPRTGASLPWVSGLEKNLPYGPEAVKAICFGTQQLPCLREHPSEFRNSVSGLPQYLVRRAYRSFASINMA
jgi:hypothetical protein